MGISQINYRPDIDGLRALAVLSVILCHAFPSLLPGGFIGVDVFFVISGYLISGIILKDLELGQFSYRKFWAHRFRRIIPALTVVLIAAWIAGWIFLPPAEYVDLGRQIAAGATYYSNILFFNEVGYFDTDSTLKPLLHLWSLGVEEQFYLAWPILLVFYFRMNLSIGKLIGMLALFSFIWNVVRVDQHSSEVFYLLPPRLWELLAGSWIAYVHFRNKPTYSNPMASNLTSWMAMIFFGLSLICIDQSTAFPGYWVLMPVVSAGLFIFAGPNGWVNQHILSSRPAVFIGLISYPLYLWHWPILVFFRRSGLPSNDLVISLLIVAAVTLAWATWKWIEQPIRKGMSLVVDSVEHSERKYLRYGLAMIIFTSLIGILTISFDGFEFKKNVGPNFYSQVSWESSYDNDCKETFGYPIENFCKMNSLKPEFMVIGDSHANHLYPGLKNAQIEVLNVGQCAPLDSVRYKYIEDNQSDKRKRACEYAPEIWEIQKKIIDETPSIKYVVIAVRWSGYVPRSRPNEVRYSFDSDNTLYVSGIASEAKLSQEQIFENGLSRVISHLESKGKEVIFFLGTPEMDFYVEKCVGKVRPLMLRPERESCGMPLSTVMDRQRDARKMASRLLSRHPELKIFDPIPYLCNGDFCPAIEDGKLFIRDIHHLTIYASNKLATAFVAFLKEESK